MPWWDGNGEERDIKYNGALNELITHLQHLFIERTNEWTAYVPGRNGEWETSNPVATPGVARNATTNTTTLRKE